MSMIVVREHFVAKPGCASKLAALWKEIAEAGWAGRFRVLTDITGEFNKVVLESEFADLAEFERRMNEYGASDELCERLRGYTDLYQTGGREIYRLW